MTELPGLQATANNDRGIDMEYEPEGESAENMLGNTSGEWHMGLLGAMEWYSDDVTNTIHMK